MVVLRPVDNLVAFSEFGYITINTLKRRCEMARSVTRNETWGALALRGVLTIIFGFAAVFWPGLTLVTLVYLFSAFILANGIVGLVLGLSNSRNEDSSLLGKVLAVALSVLEIGVGVYLLRHVNVSFKTFILLIGLTLIVRGVIDFFVGLFEAEGAMYKTAMIIGGILAAVAGAIILSQPVTAGVAFVWILGLYALVMGPLLVAMAMDIKNNG